MRLLVELSTLTFHGMASTSYPVANWTPNDYKHD